MSVVEKVVARRKVPFCDREVAWHDTAWLEFAAVASGPTHVVPFPLIIVGLDR